MIYILVAIATYISATLYRLGGASEFDAEREYGWIPRWIRLLPKKRDAGCGIVSGLIMWYLFPSTPWWIHLAAFGTLWGALSTYHDTYFYNWMKPNDNFWLHGFVCGLAYMWYALADPWLVPWILLRAVVMAVFMGMWSHVFTIKTQWEENGRGGIIPLTLPILLI